MADNEPSEKSVQKSDSLKQIEEQIENIEPELLDNLSDEKKRQVIGFAYKVTRYQGPLPDPEMLLRYKEVHADFPERILQMAEKSAESRIELQHKKLDGQIKIQSRGQHYALIIGIVALLTASGLTYLGHEIAGSIIGVGGIAGLITPFLKVLLSKEDKS